MYWGHIPFCRFLAGWFETLLLNVNFNQIVKAFSSSYFKLFGFTATKFPNLDELVSTVILGHMNLRVDGEQEHVTPVYNTVKQIILHCNKREPTDTEGNLPRASLTWRKQTSLRHKCLEFPILDRQEEDQMPLGEVYAQISLWLQHSVLQLWLTDKTTFWPPITHKCWVLNPDAIFPGNLGRQEVKMRRITVHKCVVVRKPAFTSSQENTEFCGQGGLCKTTLIVFGTRLCRIRNGI